MFHRKCEALTVSNTNGGDFPGCLTSTGSPHGFLIAELRAPCRSQTNEEGTFWIDMGRGGRKARRVHRFAMSAPAMLFRLLVPYVAVGIGWCLLGWGWQSLLAYHVLILAGSRGRWKGVFRGTSPGWLWASVAPCALAGLILFLLIPVVAPDPALADWLVAHGIGERALLFFIPYFGLIHPMLEQVHWRDLRPVGWVAHAAFAGYHALVLGSLVEAPWLVAILIGLAVASWSWGWITQETGGLLIPIAGHSLADLGVIVAAAAWLAG